MTSIAENKKREPFFEKTFLPDLSDVTMTEIETVLLHELSLCKKKTFYVDTLLYENVVSNLLKSSDEDLQNISTNFKCKFYAVIQNISKFHPHVKEYRCKFYPLQVFLIVTDNVVANNDKNDKLIKQFMKSTFDSDNSYTNNNYSAIPNYVDEFQYFNFILDNTNNEVDIDMSKFCCYYDCLNGNAYLGNLQTSDNLNNQNDFVISKKMFKNTKERYQHFEKNNKSRNLLFMMCDLNAEIEKIIDEIQRIKTQLNMLKHDSTIDTSEIDQQTEYNLTNVKQDDLANSESDNSELNSDSEYDSEYETKAETETDSEFEEIEDNNYQTKIALLIGNFIINATYFVCMFLITMYLLIWVDMIVDGEFKKMIYNI